MRAARSTLALAGVLWALGCLDVAAPASARRVALNVYPEFAVGGAGGVDASGPSDVDSFVVHISNPPLSDTTISVRVDPGQDSIVIPVSVATTLGTDTVTISFEGYSSASGMLLYSGSVTVTVVSGLTPTETPVPVIYVGPGRGVHSLAIAPNAVALQPNNTVQFSATALDTAGAPLPPDSVPVRYVSRDPSVVVVNGSGLAQALATGATYVLVRSVARSSIKDSARVTVSTVPPPVLGLSPTTVGFTATVGGGNPADQTVTVSNTGGGSLGGLAVGAVSYGAGGSGWLSASLSGASAPATLTLHVTTGALAAGHYTATVPVTTSAAGNSPQNVSVSFDVSGSVLASIAVTPGDSIVRPGDAVTLTVTGKDGTGATVPVSGVTFVSRAPSVATVGGSSGTVTAVAGGTAVIVAQAGAGIADSMVVTVAGDGSAVVSAVGDRRAFDGVRVGDTVHVRVAVDLRGVASEKLGSYDAEVDWDPTLLTLTGVAEVPGGFSGATINCPLNSGLSNCSLLSNQASGTVRFGGADPNGLVGPRVALLDLTFVATKSGASALALSMTDISAASTFTNLLPSAVVVSGHVRVQ